MFPQSGTPDSSHLHSWPGYCYGCGSWYCGGTLGGCGYPTCPSCQYYDSTQQICVSTPACYGGSCPQCQYLDPSCQVKTHLCTPFACNELVIAERYVLA